MGRYTRSHDARVTIEARTYFDDVAVAINDTLKGEESHEKLEEAFDE